MIVNDAWLQRMCLGGQYRSTGASRVEGFRIEEDQVPLHEDNCGLPGTCDWRKWTTHLTQEMPAHHRNSYTNECHRIEIPFGPG